ncbi:MAG: AAA family ATPase [Candidatus Thorarchaeota archaeon]
MRNQRKILQKKSKSVNKKENIPNKQANYVVLRPAGYPLRISGEETINSANITTDNPKLFKEYSVSQWGGLIVERGDFLFDSMIFPDFAFRVVKVVPNPSEIGPSTKIELEVNKEQIQKPIPIRLPVRFSDIIGQNEAKKKCQVIQKFLMNESLLQSPWAPRNIIFYGAPGTGKTMMARALATESNSTFIAIKASELIGVFVGEGSKKIQSLFAQAKKNTPCIVFLDELDAIALKRNYQSVRGDVVEIVSSLLGELDGFHENKGIITIAATNLVSEIDPAILSRFEEVIEFKMPTTEERIDILVKKSNTSPIKFDVNWKIVSAITKGWTGRDLVEKLLKNAIHSAILEDSDIIKTSDLEKIVNGVVKEEKQTHYI